MATITSGASQTYAGTSESTQKIVGYNGGKNYVVRYAFTTGSEGASSVSWELGGNSLGGGTAQTLRWYITTSSTSHINAGATTTKYHGNAKSSVVGGYTVFSGSADIVMLPNTTYYLWIFPSVATYGFYWLTANEKATLTISGAAGLVRIDSGSAFEAYQCYIDNGSAWEAYMPYIDNGSSWDLSG